MLFNTLVDFYKSIPWDMAQIPNETVLHTRYKGNNEDLWDFVVASLEEENTVVMFARSPLPCPSEKFDEFSIFMQKANFTMNLGAWVMDRGDGEVRFRVGFDVGAYELTQLYLRKLTIYTNMTMETYLPGIRALIKDGKSAREAYGIVFPGR
jgi:hypothetical protein